MTETDDEWRGERITRDDHEELDDVDALRYELWARSRHPPRRPTDFDEDEFESWMTGADDDTDEDAEDVTLEECDPPEFMTDRDEPLEFRETTPAEPVLRINTESWQFTLDGYDTDSEDSAHVCCSECGESIEFVTRNGLLQGGVCGCRETPGEWRADEL